LTESPTV